jgi:hypothetical protein
MNFLDDTTDGAEPLIAYVYGGSTPPDFAAIAASGFSLVCLDTTAPWFTDTTVADAEANGLIAVAFPMAYSPANSARIR